MESAPSSFVETLQEIGTFLLDYLSNPWVMIGIGLLILVLLIILGLLGKKQPSRIRAFNNDSGYVEISRSALVDIIRTTSEQADIDRKPGVQVSLSRGKLNVEVRIRMLPTRKLTEVSGILQQHLKEALVDGLGIRKLGRINVIVTGVRVKAPKQGRQSLPLFNKPPEGPKKPEEPETAPVEIVNEESESEKSAELQNRAEPFAPPEAENQPKPNS